MQNDNPMSQDELVSRIQALTASVRADNNPEELEKIRKLIKKNVPFTLRGYFMAYILRELTKAPARQSRREPREPRRSQAPAHADAAPAREEKKSTVREKSEATAKREPRPIPADAKTLYINLGKMGHVYARDLVSLITADGEISRDDIYQIRLHDKYSFVTMSEADCLKTIEKLQGQVHRNRTIQVNFSNKDRKAADQSVEEKVSDGQEAGDSVQD